ncbi:hypothetical protein SAMN02927921_03097 [Sinomicrobium oceani]|uniref:Uncharacterized protein n=1 Tax=Sinomicrobium oceani TaxID=1150368 RepID=A0A1K1R2Q5_9FLAO|nr:hypothetical protein [Sinomicrobium oceani]SFW66220.1 hypothetical protein SAMN02927921_03097 [Sinomicrobium oceani]
MSIAKYFLRLQYIDFLIRMKATGDQGTLARKIHLSKSGLANVLKDMKGMGFPIKYDKNRQTYLYTREGKMVKELFVENKITAKAILTTTELKKIDLSDVKNLCFDEIKVFRPCEKNIKD